MLQQTNTTELKNVRRFLQLRRISEFCGLCCYVRKPDPWSPYSNADPDPTACDPRYRPCDSWSHPIFCCWSLIPYTLLRPCYKKNNTRWWISFAVLFGLLVLVQKLEPAKISCHKVTAYASLDFTKCIRNNFKLKVPLFSASTDSHEILSAVSEILKMKRRQRGKNNDRSVHWV